MTAHAVLGPVIAATHSPAQPTSTVAASTSGEIRNCTTHNPPSVPPQASQEDPVAILCSARKMSGGTGANTRFRCELPCVTRYGENPYSSPPANAAGRQVTHWRMST